MRKGRGDFCGRAGVNLGILVQKFPSLGIVEAPFCKADEINLETPLGSCAALGICVHDRCDGVTNNLLGLEPLLLAGVILDQCPHEFNLLGLSYAFYVIKVAIGVLGNLMTEIRIPKFKFLPRRALTGLYDMLINNRTEAGVCGNVGTLAKFVKLGDQFNIRYRRPAVVADLSLHYVINGRGLSFGCGL